MRREAIVLPTRDDDLVRSLRSILARMSKTLDFCHKGSSGTFLSLIKWIEVKTSTYLCQ